MEHYEIMVYETAESDIRDAVGYISKTLRELNTAQAMSKRFQEAITSLNKMPERFPLVPDSYLASIGIRTTSVGNYLIFYTVNQAERRVEVSRVLYGKRNWIRILTDDNP